MSDPARRDPPRTVRKMETYHAEAEAALMIAAAGGDIDLAKLALRLAMLQARWTVITDAEDAMDFAVKYVQGARELRDQLASGAPGELAT